LSLSLRVQRAHIELIYTKNNKFSEEIAHDVLFFILKVKFSAELV